jgi:hypothetical protein
MRTLQRTFLESILREAAHCIAERLLCFCQVEIHGVLRRARRLKVDGT